MKQNLVSVIIPVYNGARFLPKTLASVSEQTWGDVEVVAVDDGSTDNSVEILKTLEGSVRIVQQENCGNVGRVRNTGIEHAHGEFIAFLDQDDWWLPEKLERQIEVMRSDERIGLVHTAVLHFDESGENSIPPVNPKFRREQMVGECFEELLLINPVCNSSVLVRRSALDDVGACDLNVPGNTVQDYDLWLRIARKHSFAFVPEPVTAYRIHANQGLWDRRTMLKAELELLLRIRERAQWLREPRPRKRLAQLYDELAVAHYDHGETTAASRYLRKACATRPTVRQLVRWALCMLPLPLVDACRSAKKRMMART